MVTLELLHDTGRLGWSLANIALASFAKLGGVPWVVDARGEDADLVVGIGRSDVQDPAGGRRRNFGYAVAFVANGAYLASRRPHDHPSLPGIRAVAARWRSMQDLPCHRPEVDARACAPRCAPGSSATAPVRRRMTGRAPTRVAEALARLADGDWPAPGTVTDLYGTWAAAHADAFA